MLLAPLDIVILIGILLIIFFLSFRLGKKFLVSLILAFYPTTLIFSNIKLIKLESILWETFVYLVIYFVIYQILRRIIHIRESGSGLSKIISHLVLSFFALIPIFFSILINLVDLRQFYSFSNGIRWFFLDLVPFEIMLIIPFLVLFATSRFRGD